MNDDGRSIPCKAKFVVEVNAGFCRKHGIKAGQKLKIEGLALAAPRELLGNGGLAHPTPAARKGWGCAPGASRKRWACAAHARGKGADGAAPRAAPLHPPAPPPSAGIRARRGVPGRSPKRPLPISSGRDPRGSYLSVSTVRLCTKRLGE
jgi:hypothetical protein